MLIKAIYLQIPAGSAKFILNGMVPRKQRMGSNYIFQANYRKELALRDLAYLGNLKQKFAAVDG